MEQTCMHKTGLVAADWWHRLPVILVPVVHYRTNETGFITVDMGTSGKAPNISILAFQDRQDAEAMQMLLQSYGSTQTAAARLQPMRPEQLLEAASTQEYSVTVYSKQQLKLRPGMSIQEMALAAVKAAEP